MDKTTVAKIFYPCLSEGCTCHEVSISKNNLDIVAVKDSKNVVYTANDENRKKHNLQMKINLDLEGFIFDEVICNQLSEAICKYSDQYQAHGMGPVEIPDGYFDLYYNGKRWRLHVILGSEKIELTCIKKALRDHLMLEKQEWLEVKDLVIEFSLEDHQLPVSDVLES